MINLDKIFSKSTVISSSIGTLIAIGSVIWFLAVPLVQAMEQIKDNAQDIRRLKLYDAKAEISNLKTEKREIQREQLTLPDNALLQQQLDDVDLELHEWELRRDCLQDLKNKECD